MTKYKLYKAKLGDIDLNKATVRSNPDMTPWERETIILMNDDSNDAEITTWQVVITKHLMQHQFCKVEHVWMIDNETIVGLDAIIPKTCIRTSIKPRQRFDKI